MIFGAGLNQLELIREAGKLGLVTVAIDPEENPREGRRPIIFAVSGPMTMKLRRRQPSGMEYPVS